MRVIFLFFENLFLRFRDFFWNLPEQLVANDDAILRRFMAVYFQSRPFSYFMFMILITATVISFVVQDVRAFLPMEQTALKEGVIVGVDERGELLSLSRVNPLIISEIQLEKDISELVYESLYQVDQEGQVIPRLIREYQVSEDRREYLFFLAEDRNWHDGEKFDSDDVVATFNLIKTFENDPNTSNIYSRAAKNLSVEVVDSYTVKVSFVADTVVPAFLEAFSFKVLPEHLISDLNFNNIRSPEPFINRNPIGTGPYKLLRERENNIRMIANEDYPEPPLLQYIDFVLFADEVSALQALKSGRIHAVAGLSVDSVRSLDDYNNLDILVSPVIYNQYWGLYFNLREGSETAFQDVRVRRALASAIDRRLIKDALYNLAEEAVGPIPVSSFAYADIDRYTYDPDKAEELLDEAGWELDPVTGLRTKEGEVLEFNLLLVDNQDRNKIANSISADLAVLGVRVNIISKSLAEVRDQHIIPKRFETLLFGVQTFKDPDRFELFHSSQIEHPGLNISSYSSVEETLAVVAEDSGGTTTEKIPIVDDALDDARKLLDEELRKEKYLIFQETVAEEVPVIFLYHPRETYIINKRLKNVTLGNIDSLEQRFDNVAEWEIAL